MAKLISKQDKKITEIRFDLSRSTSGTKLCSISLKKLADARESLLLIINAQNVKSTQTDLECFEVVGIWHKEDWFKPNKAFKSDS